MTIPSTAPNTAMMKASSTMVRRIPLRSMPTARSRPISRVRSKTLSAKVLTIPSRAISTASTSSAKRKFSSCPIWSPMLSLNADWSSTCTLGKGSRARLRSASTLVASASVSLTT